MPDPFNLQRFIDAQAPVYEQVLSELRRGKKTTHWMWFIFPQLRGLGKSQTSQYYGLSGTEEATAYVAHPVLGPRLIECTELVRESGQKLTAIFGTVDAMKFASCMKLFSALPEWPTHLRE